jgi:hypothetical protein
MKGGFKKIVPVGVFVLFAAFGGMTVLLAARKAWTPAAHHAGGINEEEEGRRNEGFLWVDRNSAKYVVTLGALNGISSGGYLAVYDEAGMIGRVKVETVREVIAYVRPLTATRELLTEDYYRVVKERREVVSSQTAVLPESDLSN